MTIAELTPSAPGPDPGLPGSILFQMRRDPPGYLLRLSQEYGDFVRIRSGADPLYLINDPDAIRDILITNHRSFSKGRGLQVSKRLLGEGLLTSEGEFHRRQRRLSQPAFHRQRVAAYAAIMADRAAHFRNTWRDSMVFDVAGEMMKLTLDIVARALFSSEMEAQTEEIGEAVTESIHMLNFAMLPFAAQLERFAFPLRNRFQRARNVLDTIIYRMIQERRADGRDRGDLLSMLLLAQDEEGGGESMTDRQLRDEVLTIFLAGHETTANALAWTWYILSQNPEVEVALHAEIDVVLGGRLPGYEDVALLPYTRKVFAESMRLYPPAWVVGRRALVDYPVDKYVLSAGSICMLSPYVMHRDPRWFPNPDQFDPERWTPEAQEARPKFSYFPFGGGPRICIGEGFAWTEGILLLATLAQMWRLRLVPDHPVRTQAIMTLRPRYGLQMVCERRRAPLL